MPGMWKMPEKYWPTFTGVESCPSSAAAPACISSPCLTTWNSHSRKRIRCCGNRCGGGSREEGGRALLGELNTVDPETAARLHENDHSRIVRALEVYRTTGIPISEQARLARRTPSPYDACLLVLDSRDRQILYERIHRRTDRMLETGLVDEARRVLRQPPCRHRHPGDWV